MVVKCPGCGGALEYDIASGKMICEYCDSEFDVEGVNQDIYEEDEKDTFYSSIYRCTCCGAQLAINDLESATFCAYCGQPTIIFDRISKCKKPKYIIPFSVTREEALKVVRKRFKKGFFIPKRIKKFEVEMLRGIYMPFWLYDIYYKDKMLLEGTVKSGKSRRTKHYLREAENTFHHISVDGSKRFINEYSQRLEPFDITGLVDFDMNYLSGYYADCNDEETVVLDTIAVDRAKKLFEEEVCESVKASDVKVDKRNPVHQILKKDYVFLPVWFLVFRDSKHTYTVMVNGQTGKMVGTVPTDKIRVGICFVILSFILAVIVGAIGQSFFTSANSSEGWKNILLAMFLIFTVLWKSFALAYDFCLCQKLTLDESMKNMVTERQEDV